MTRPEIMRDEPINILLVDDQPGKLLGYQAILSDLGENLLMAHSAREALEILLKEDVALILIDVCMPELDGFELAEMIRAHPRFEKTAIMFVSGVNLSDLDRIRGYSAGALDYVSVPVVPELLRAKVRVFADLHRKTRQLETLNRELEDRIALRTADLEASTLRWQESEQRLRMALASARAGAWEWWFDPSAMRWSPELFALLGLPTDAAVPSFDEFLALVHVADRERVRSLFDALPSTCGAFELEFRVNTAGATPTTAWIRTTGEVVIDTKGRPILARGIHQDVTSRKHAELQLETEARRKDEFLATLAHELRNPLAPIATCVRMLRKHDLDPAARDRSHQILDRQVAHLVRLVDDLIDVSRISRGKITLRREPVDVAAVVRSTLEASVIASGDRKVIAQIPDRGPWVSADPVRLAQVVSNILDNAVKFTPVGGTITVEVREDGDRALLRVKDTGAGIPPDQLERVFELFTQVDGQNGRGLGIGLALVRHLVELHGGRVRAASDGVGAGTEIAVELPRVAAPQGAVVEELPPREPSGGKRLRFLIVDDNVDAADTLAELLQLSGYEARTAYEAGEATRLGARFEPHVVLLDLGMPTIDGFEIARRMRETTWGRAAKLVAVTGWGQPSDRRRTSDAGFDGHLVKPIELQELLGLVQSAAAILGRVAAASPET